MENLEMVETIDMQVRVRHPTFGVLLMSIMITGEVFRLDLDAVRNQINREIGNAIKLRSLDVD